jgi:hypothetical protein
VELCTTSQQKESSEWNVELWNTGENGKEEKQDGKEQERKENAFPIVGVTQFVLRNSVTLKYLSVVDRDDGAVLTTWVDEPSFCCVFSVSGPGADAFSKRLSPEVKKVSLFTIMVFFFYLLV